MSELDKLIEQAPSTLDRFRLDNKTAIMVGGNQGLGQAMAMALADRDRIGHRLGQVQAAGAAGFVAGTAVAVLLISSDLAEVLNVSHRIAVYRDGRILQTVPADKITPEEVMQQLTGAGTDEGL